MADESEPLIDRLAAALEHMRICRSCSEDAWHCCDEGRKAEAALEEYNRIKQ